MVPVSVGMASHLPRVLLLVESTYLLYNGGPLHPFHVHATGFASRIGLFCVRIMLSMAVVNLLSLAGMVP